MTIVILMGVTGAGKSTIGRQLSQALGWSFYDGDDYHSPANVAKMARGLPLSDADRTGWLAQLAGLIARLSEQGQDAVLACSALKRNYRLQLRKAGRDVRFVYLKAERELLLQRMQDRPGHFMPVSLLDSQLATLEEPRCGLMASADSPVNAIIDQIQHWLQESKDRDGGN